jgi:hypothetical protein
MGAPQKARKGLTMIFGRGFVVLVAVGGLGLAWIHEGSFWAGIASLILGVLYLVRVLAAFLVALFSMSDRGGVLAWAV